MVRISNSFVRPVTVGVALEGAGWHPSAWRELGGDAHHVFQGAYWQKLATEAEQAGVDYLTIEDSLSLQTYAEHLAPGEDAVPALPQPEIFSGRLDAALIASWLAPLTRRIGLVPTVTTTYTEPFHVATGLQTLDHTSRGRAGWQLRVSGSAADAAAFGRKPAPALDAQAIGSEGTSAGFEQLLDEAEEFATVARLLWDSWEEDAIIRDVETGRFLDRERVHHVNFEGEYFSIAGPSIVPRSPQGVLPVTLLAHNEPVFRLAAKTADVVFITAEIGRDSGDVRKRVALIREIEQAEGREALGLSPLRVVVDIVVALDQPEESASTRFQRLEAYGPEFSSDAQLLLGSVWHIADQIEAIVAAGAQGIRLRPLTNLVDLPAIGALLLPELRARGVVADQCGEVAQLRQVFGLAECATTHGTTRTNNTAREEQTA